MRASDSDPVNKSNILLCIEIKIHSKCMMIHPSRKFVIRTARGFVVKDDRVTLDIF